MIIYASKNLSRKGTRSKVRIVEIEPIGEARKKHLSMYERRDFDFYGFRFYATSKNKVVESLHSRLMEM